MGLVDVILKTIDSNPDIQKKINSNQVTKSYWDTIKRGDQKAGEELANRILDTYGLSKEEGIKQANQGLNGMFGSK